ncbi:MAG: hypothetical protein AAGA73_00430 [Pseudomonadota bacterium]
MEGTSDDRKTLVADYKALLREFIDQRPPGLRNRLAKSLGKHKSFVSQITNPSYRVPIPARDVQVIFDVCNLGADERRRFLELYEKAHSVEILPGAVDAGTHYEITLLIPRFDDSAVTDEVETMIRDFATRIVQIASKSQEKKRRKTSKND